MKNTLIVIVTIIVIALLGWIAYSVAENRNMSAEAPTTTETPTSGTNIQTTVGVNNPPAPKTDSFTVTAKNYSFTPSKITVNKGDTVQITVVNSGGTHDLVVEGYGVKTNMLSSGQEQTISFVADKTGTFEYYCSVGNHRAMGMKGTLTVQ